MCTQQVGNEFLLVDVKIDEMRGKTTLPKLVAPEVEGPKTRLTIFPSVCAGVQSHIVSVAGEDQGGDAVPVIKS